MNLVPICNIYTEMLKKTEALIKFFLLIFEAPAWGGHLLGNSAWNLVTEARWWCGSHKTGDFDPWKCFFSNVQILFSSALTLQESRLPADLDDLFILVVKPFEMSFFLFVLFFLPIIMSYFANFRQSQSCLSGQNMYYFKIIPWKSSCSHYRCVGFPPLSKMATFQFTFFFFLF